MESNLQPNDNLSKRQQNKIEKLGKNAQILKTQTHAKSYKRKASGRRYYEDHPRRILINAQINSQQEKNQSESSMQNKKDQAGIQPVQIAKKPIKKICPLNKNFFPQQKSQKMFDYIMVYAFTERQKKLNNQQQDSSFLNLIGEQLQIKQIDKKIKDQKLKANQKFQSIKQQLEIPFDQNYRDIVANVLPTISNNI